MNNMNDIRGTAMNPRINYMQETPDLIKRLVELGQLNSKGSLSPTILDLVHIRASQLNGCAFCLDMHVKEAKLHGERELRVYHLSIWRESPLFSDKERAALEWTEAVTHISEGQVPDTVYDTVTPHFTEAELVALTFAVVAINSWNRLAISFRAVPGTYQSPHARVA